MRVLVNALSVTNLSGRHVLLGHLSRVARWMSTTHEFTVLYHRSNRDLRRDLGPNLNWLEAPAVTRNWAARNAWERAILPRVAKRLGANVMFTPAGTTIGNLDLRQISFAQNPWSLVDDVPRSAAGRVKASLQRSAYARAMHDAAVMVFNSEYMREAYRHNSGCVERASAIIYQGVDESTFEAAASLAGADRRASHAIVCVSVMAPHKGVETLVEAVDVVRRSHGCPATLSLIGPWPDSVYERAIRALVKRLDLEKVVDFRGHVSRDELYRAYAQARVFALMSRCESFGIPAVEAQAFGTPVVSSNCCAIPEVCGHGGVFPGARDVIGVSNALLRLIQDDAHWEETSAAATANAARFHWDRCSEPFRRVFAAV